MISVINLQLFVGSWSGSRLMLVMPYSIFVYPFAVASSAAVVCDWGMRDNTYRENYTDILQR